MRKFVELAGFLLLVMGVSGTIDHLAVQPILGFLNVLSRFVFPKVVPGYELYANLTVAALGLALLVAAVRSRPAGRPRPPHPPPVPPAHRPGSR
jgi:hypothetical protein